MERDFDTKQSCTAFVIAQAYALAFLNKQISFGLFIITPDLLPGLLQGILFGSPILLAMFGLFLLIGWKLRKVHYPDVNSRKWFMLFISLSFWGGLALTMFVA